MNTMYKCLLNRVLIATFAFHSDAETYCLRFQKTAGRESLVLLAPGVPEEGFVVDTIWESSKPGTTCVFPTWREAEAARQEFMAKPGLNGPCVSARVRALTLRQMSAVARDEEGDLIEGEYEHAYYGAAPE